MIRKRFLTDAEHEGEAELESLRLQKVALSSNNETTCGNEHTRGGRLRDLICIDPVDLACHFVLPTWTVAHLKSGCFVERKCRYGLPCGVLDNTDGGTMEL